MMNPQTNLFTQNWTASAADETAGFINNWQVFTPSRRIRLMHLSLANLPRVAHVRLFVTSYNGELFNLADDDFPSGQSAVWNGSIIMTNVTSIGAQAYGYLAGDISYLRIIWEELD